MDFPAQQQKLNSKANNYGNGMDAAIRPRNGTDQVTVEAIDLTTLTNPEDSFIFVLSHETENHF